MHAAEITETTNLTQVEPCMLQARWKHTGIDPLFSSLSTVNKKLLISLASANSHSNLIGKHLFNLDCNI